ncbi:MAG: tyrosine-type recombinase/integrase [Candidatus Aenigmarchaeota archaeon]|nr:tyrosine-type recombinase/integrase [Candidatus Aenigmarchaeota archaeon]
MAKEDELKASIGRLRGSPISARNKKSILRFSDFCLSTGLHVNTIKKYLCYLPKMAEMLGKDFEKCSREDVMKFMARIEGSDMAERTKYDYKKMIKRFYKWLLGEDEFYPPQVRWIKCSLKNCYKMLPEDLLSEDEIRKLIEAATNMRDKSLVSMLYEGGFRIGEVLPLKMKHIEFNAQFARVTVPQEGKTGVRRVLLVNSAPYIANWLSHHEQRGDPNASVWVSIRHNGKKTQYNTVRSLLIDLAKKAGVKKRVNPHSFRHARATHLAGMLTESQMKQYLGWTQGSKMAAVYVHLSGRDVDNRILEMHGLKKPEEEEKARQMEPKICPACEKANEFEARICCRCGRVLDIKAAIEEENAYEKRISGFFAGRPETLADLMAYLKAEIRKQIEQELDIKSMKTELLEKFRRDLEKEPAERVLERMRIAAK